MKYITKFKYEEFFNSKSTLSRKDIFSNSIRYVIPIIYKENAYINEIDDSPEY